jgi:hypothetical protein
VQVRFPRRGNQNLTHISSKFHYKISLIFLNPASYLSHQQVVLITPELFRTTDAMHHPSLRAAIERAQHPPPARRWRATAPAAPSPRTSGPACCLAWQLTSPRAGRTPFTSTALITRPCSSSQSVRTGAGEAAFRPHTAWPALHDQTLLRGQPWMVARCV